MPSDPREEPRQPVVDRVLAFWPEIVVAARAHGLDPATLAGLVCQESAGKPDAKRHEPGYRWDFGDDPHEHPTLPPGLSLSEDLELQKWSYGLCQIMGAVAREHGFAGHLEELLTDTAANLELGARHLARQMKRANGDARQALLYYNGGGDQAYDDKVLAWAAYFASRAAGDNGQTLFEQPTAQAAPREDAAQAPFRKEDNMPTFLVPSLILPLAIKLGASMVPQIIKALLPESAKAFGAHLKEETRLKIKDMLNDFQEFADSTSHETVVGKIDDILATAFWAVAEGLGLLPGGVSVPSAPALEQSGG